MNQRLKQIIFNKLYKDLSHVEIIPHKDSVWFIDRKEKYWYLEYKKNGALYWRWQFFPKYFNLFSLEEDEFEPIISEWVEEILNRKIVIPKMLSFHQIVQVEEILNRKIVIPFQKIENHVFLVEEVLNCKVVTSISPAVPLSSWVEEALNCKVVKPSFTRKYSGVEEVLNCKVVMPSMASIPSTSRVEEALNCKVTTQGAIGELHFSLVEQVLNAK